MDAPCDCQAHNNTNAHRTLPSDMLGFPDLGLPGMTT